MPNPNKKRQRTAAERLNAELDRHEAAQKRQLVNYDHVWRNPETGAINYERVRTVATPANCLTETPASPENGQLIAAETAPQEPVAAAEPAAEVVAAQIVTALPEPAPVAAETAAAAPILEHEVQIGGQQIAPADAADEADGDPLHELLARAQQRPRRGRPAVCLTIRPRGRSWPCSPWA